MTDLDWPACRNARDLGGLGNVRPGALYRSDGLFLLTAAGIDAVRAAGVSLILDLRRPSECEREPSPFAGEPGYRHVSILEEVVTYEIPHDSYGPMLDFNKPRIADAFRALAAAPPGAVLVYCHGGRDRTAVVVALALAVAGVPPEQIVADYGRSPDRLPGAMAATLDHLETVYGGAESYLDHIGVTPAEVRAVRRRLTGTGEAGPA
ncbi:tyrosine-protein phosphatase [Actinoplanes sp. CA-030573]|uniref:tyrosine-protein phosphatase n=1 Tax=Actinoplanes sp. CA-030573 TaxID=3239898 RepID=UPI003D8EC029